MQAIGTGEVIADYGEPTKWSDFDASVFLITVVGKQMQGEYQLCNGYGTDKAAQVLRVRSRVAFPIQCSPFFPPLMAAAFTGRRKGTQQLALLHRLVRLVSSVRLQTILQHVTVRVAITCRCDVAPNLLFLSTSFKCQIGTNIPSPRGKRKHILPRIMFILLWDMYKSQALSREKPCRFTRIMSILLWDIILQSSFGCYKILSSLLVFLL